MFITLLSFNLNHTCSIETLPSEISHNFNIVNTPSTAYIKFRLIFPLFTTDQRPFKYGNNGTTFPPSPISHDCVHRTLNHVNHEMDIEAYLVYRIYIGEKSENERQM